MHAIVIDSSLVIQEIISDALLADGYQVSLFSTGEEALTVIRSMQPDLVLLARLLPDVGGLEVLDELQGDVWTYQIPVIFVTSAQRTRHIRQALRGGATDFLLKPFSADTVRSKAAAAIDGCQETKGILDN